MASKNLAVTTGAPKGWTPAQPLMTNKPPYPTEDLIRRSSLYQMMVQPSSVTASKSDEIVQTTKPESVIEAKPVRSRRRGATAADKSKLLDLDLNPDM